MANNTRIEPYVRTANTLDQIGFFRQADNVESLMRVGMAMDAGQPLFNNVKEHREYLELLRFAKQLILSNNTNERTAGEKTFVLGEIDRYIELWSFMLNEERKVRIAQRSLPFSLRFASNTDGELTPGQISMLNTLAPVFRNIWLNGIRESFGKSNAVYTPKELNAIGSNIVKSLKLQSLGDREDISIRDFSNDMRKELAKAKMISGEEERSPERIVQVQFEGLSNLQTPEARQITELLVSKQLEPEVQRAQTPQDREVIAANAAALINWFLEPLPNIQSTMGLVEEKARMVGMPSDVALPDDFFESSAGDPETNGIRWFDQNEIDNLLRRSNPEYSITDFQPSDSPVTQGEEIQVDETPIQQNETGDAQTLDTVPTETPVAQSTKKRKGKQIIETPVQTPETPVETPKSKGKGKQIDEPVQSPVGIDNSGADNVEDIGMSDVDAQVPTDIKSTVDAPDEAPLGSEIENSSDESKNDGPEVGLANDIVGIIKDFQSKASEKSESETNALKSLSIDIIKGGELAKKAIATIVYAYNNDVSFDNSKPDADVMSGLTENSANQVASLIVEGMGWNEENNPMTSGPEEEHAPGTISTKPGEFGGDNEPELDLNNDKSADESEEYTGPWPLNRELQKQQRLKRFLVGLGLSSAAVLAILAQMAPGGAAKEAIPLEYPPQSGYSQPMQPQPEPQYDTPSVQQPEYTPPVVPAPRTEQPAPQQQVPRPETPKKPDIGNYQGWIDD
jgi:hypothetical protein